MFKVEIDLDELSSVIRAAVAEAVSNQPKVASLPPVLSKKQFMELLDIGSTKATELLNREDFPVIREMGVPRVLTHLLLTWMEEHTEWVRKNAGPASIGKRKGPPELRRAK